jgi:hypothetical protein
MYQFSGHILPQTFLSVKRHVITSSGFRVLLEGLMEEGIERNADGWTKIEKKTFTFSTLQKFYRMVFLIFL